MFLRMPAETPESDPEPMRGPDIPDMADVSNWIKSISAASQHGGGAFLRRGKRTAEALTWLRDQGRALGLEDLETFDLLVRTARDWRSFGSAIVWTEARDDPQHKRHPAWRSFQPWLITLETFIRLMQHYGMAQRAAERIAAKERDESMQKRRRELLMGLQDRLLDVLGSRTARPSAAVENDLYRLETTLQQVDAPVQEWVDGMLEAGQITPAMLTDNDFSLPDPLYACLHR